MRATTGGYKPGDSSQRFSLQARRFQREVTAARSIIDGMNRRKFLQAGSVLMAPKLAASSPDGGRPNILIIFVDQLRFDCLGANGNRIIKTPNLDRLAGGAANFTHAYVQAAVCVPSRISYLTGRYPHSHKNRVNYTPCDPNEIMMQRMLREFGYQTGSVGKLHFYPPTVENARSTGFDRVYLDDGVVNTDPYSDYIRWRQRMTRIRR